MTDYHYSFPGPKTWNLTVRRVEICAFRFEMKGGERRGGGG